MSIERRTFFSKLSSAIFLGILGGLSCQRHGKPTVPFGLNLASLDNSLKINFEKTCEQAAAIGFKEFEFTGFYGHSSLEIKNLLQNLSISPIGNHIDFHDLVDNFDKIVEFNISIGSRYIIIPSIPQDFRDKGVAGYVKFAAELNRLGARLADANLKLAYHNHDFEFEMVEDKFLYDWMIEATDPNLVKLELDIYMIEMANISAASFFERYKNRCELIQINDMSPEPPYQRVPVGTGSLEIEHILRTALGAHVKHIIIEQENFTQTPINEIEKSFKNLTTIFNKVLNV